MSVIVDKDGNTFWQEDVNIEMLTIEVATIEDIQIKITDLKNQVNELETQINNMN